MTRFGLLGEDEKELDFVLQLTTEKMLERRLQTKVSVVPTFMASMITSEHIFSMEKTWECDLNVYADGHCCCSSP